MRKCRLLEPSTNLWYSVPKRLGGILLDSPILLAEAETERETALFRQAMDEMLERDVRPHCDLCAPMSDGEAAFFLSPEYHGHIDALCRREQDPARRFFFRADGRDIGFALCCTYRSEDGKCFVIDFCVYPPYRCRGLGKRCFAALAERMEAEGARYFELNTHCRRSLRFWESLGFRPNGCDESGMILLCRPPEERLPFTAELLTDPGDPALGWQWRKLENGFLAGTGAGPADDRQKRRLARAVRERRFLVFLVRRGCRAVGMCAVSPVFDPDTGGKAGVCARLFVEPVFRGQGAARRLMRFVRQWCRRHGYSVLTAAAPAGDAELCRALGFGPGPEALLVCPLGKN